MRALLLGLALAAALPPAPTVSAAQLEGIEFADRLAPDDWVLRNLALLRYRYFFKVYVAALYLKPGDDLGKVLTDVPKRLEISYLRGFRADQFAQSTLDGIAKNVAPAELERLRPRIGRFNRLYRDVERGDRYALSYVPGRGTELAWNGRPLGAIEGADFAVAMFSIWLGEHPLDADLKRALLAPR